MTRFDPWAQYERLLRQDPTTLSPAEVRLLAVGGLRTEVNNGGFHQYFSNSAGDLAPQAAEAAAHAGAHDLEALVRRGLARLNLSEPTNQGLRQHALDDIEPEDFDDLDAAFYALEESTDLDGVMRVWMNQAD